MAIRKIDRGEWRGFCIRASRLLIGKQVEIEIVSLQIGAQLEARGLPFLGITFDPATDILELLVGELDHLIQEPRELYVDEQPIGIVSFQIVDSSGFRQIVTLRDPLLLPSPARD